jgi:hypothetical protein
MSEKYRYPHRNEEYWMPTSRQISMSKLMTKHKTSKGIYLQNGRIESVQLVYPNNYGYKNFFFEGRTFCYEKSKSDESGNKALADAFRNKICFRAYLRYKDAEKGTNKTDHAKIHNIPVTMVGKIYYLGIVRIVEERGNAYVLERSEGASEEEFDKTMESILE